MANNHEPPVKLTGLTRRDIIKGVIAAGACLTRLGTFSAVIFRRSSHRLPARSSV